MEVYKLYNTTTTYGLPYTYGKPTPGGDGGGHLKNGCVDFSQFIFILGYYIYLIKFHLIYFFSLYD